MSRRITRIGRVAGIVAIAFSLMMTASLGRVAGIKDSVAAAHAAMLHCGARGYRRSHRAQRRLREAYFVAIVTPATKQLRKMLQDA